MFLDTHRPRELMLGGVGGTSLQTGIMEMGVTLREHGRSHSCYVGSPLICILTT